MGNEEYIGWVVVHFSVADNRQWRTLWLLLTGLVSTLVTYLYSTGIAHLCLSKCEKLKEWSLDRQTHKECRENVHMVMKSIGTCFKICEKLCHKKTKKNMIFQGCSN